MKAIQIPYPYFADSSGEPLENGKIYIGVENQNPETSPVDVWADEAGTIAVAQPIRTSGGYMVQTGSPINVFVEGRYSITVKSQHDVLIFNRASNADQTQATGSDNAVDDLGIVNDGTGDQGTLINNALADNANLFFPAGTYNIDTLLIIDCANASFSGVPGGTVFTSATLTELAQIVSMDNVHFYGITFQSTVNTAATSDAVIIGPDCSITDSTFERCEMTAPDCRSGGMYISGTSTVDNFRIDQCLVNDVGGIGLYIDGTTIKNANIVDNKIGTTGQYSGDSGTAITLKNASLSSISGNKINDAYGDCIHIDTVVTSAVENNTFSGLTRDCNPLVVGTGGTSEDVRFTNNLCVSRVTNGGVTLASMSRPVFHGNVWLLSDKFSLSNVTSLKATDDVIDTQDVQAVYITGTSTNNEWKGGIITNSTAATSASNDSVLTDGAGVTDNRFLSVEVYKETAGQLSGTANGAEAVSFINCYGDSTQAGDGIVESITPVVEFLDMTDVAYTSSGSLVKNGGIVSGHLSIIFTNKGSGAAGDDLYISGFPYAMTFGSAYAYYYTDMSLGSIKPVTGTSFFGDKFRMLQLGTANAAAIERSDLTNSTVINVSFQYITTD